MLAIWPGAFWLPARSERGVQLYDGTYAGDGRGDEETEADANLLFSLAVGEESRGGWNQGGPRSTAEQWSASLGVPGVPG